jgi:hypothetical protein
VHISQGVDDDVRGYKGVRSRRRNENEIVVAAVVVRAGMYNSKSKAVEQTWRSDAPLKPSASLSLTVCLPGPGFVPVNHQQLLSVWIIG